MRFSRSVRSYFSGLILKSKEVTIFLGKVTELNTNAASGEGDIAKEVTSGAVQAF